MMLLHHVNNFNAGYYFASAQLLFLALHFSICCFYLHEASVLPGFFSRQRRGVERMNKNFTSLFGKHSSWDACFAVFEGIKLPIGTYGRLDDGAAN